MAQSEGRKAQTTRPREGEGSMTGNGGGGQRTQASLTAPALLVKCSNSARCGSCTATARWETKHCALSVWRSLTSLNASSSRAHAATRCCTRAVNLALISAQMCRFCWHQICEEGDSKCPNCRQPYTRGNINLTPLTAEQCAFIVPALPHLTFFFVGWLR